MVSFSYYVFNLFPGTSAFFVVPPTIQPRIKEELPPLPGRLLVFVFAIEGFQSQELNWLCPWFFLLFAVYSGEASGPSLWLFQDTCHFSRDFYCLGHPARNGEFRLKLALKLRSGDVGTCSTISAFALSMVSKQNCLPITKHLILCHKRPIYGIRIPGW